jgi:DNA-binding CsgD family transcriptional regulator
MPIRHAHSNNSGHSAAAAYRPTLVQVDARSGASDRSGRCPLTGREFEILRLMALEGLQTDGIGHRLGITGSTVRQHCQNAYRKLGVTHAVQALVVCFNAGWIDPLQTRVQDPLRFSTDRVWTPSPAQHVYLDCFDEHLLARDDRRALEAAKRKTEAALLFLDQPRRSVASRDWIDELIRRIRAFGQRRRERRCRRADTH